MATSPPIKLTQMLDMALGSPEVGAVNFNVLHQLLHGIISKLNLHEETVVVDSVNSRQPSAVTSASLADREASLASASDSGFQSSSTIAASGSGTAADAPGNFLHSVQTRLSSLEKQIDTWNSTPTNRDLLDQAMNKAAADASSPEKRLISDLWQTLQLKKRVDGHDEGISRLTLLLDDLMEEMGRLKQENSQLRQQMSSLPQLSAIMQRLDALQTRVDQLKSDMDANNSEFKKFQNSAQTKLDSLPSGEFYRNLVTWEGLEKALRGIKEDLARLENKQPAQHLIETATDPISRPVSEQSSTGPSEVLAEMLAKIGCLGDSHDKLEVRVDTVEQKLPDKVDRSELDGKLGGGPAAEEAARRVAELAEALEAMRVETQRLSTVVDEVKRQLEAMNAHKQRDAEALARIRELLNALQQRMGEVNDTLQQLAADERNAVAKIEQLFSITEKHGQSKADVQFVLDRIEPLADKTLVESKVARDTFDETTDSLTRLVHDLMAQLKLSEEELKNLLHQVQDDLTSRISSEDLEALRQWVEKRLKSLADRLKNLRSGADPMLDTDDAAGLRKQLMHFHCISCDRPMDLMAQGIPAPGLPEARGLPMSKSLRPYTTFELDAIRQQARSYIEPYRIAAQTKPGSSATEVIDLYQTPRPCGGSHTTTHPHKRVSKMAAISSIIEEQNGIGGSGSRSNSPIKREELDLQGLDGNIYKGRLDRSMTTLTERLPPVVMDSAGVGSGSGGPHNEHVQTSSRPKSAVRLTPRVQIEPSSSKISANQNNTAALTSRISSAGRPVSANKSGLRKKTPPEEENGGPARATTTPINDNEPTVLNQGPSPVNDAIIAPSEVILETTPAATARNELNDDQVEPVLVQDEQ